MDVRMDGRVAVITGGSTGLGLAMAKEFAASGASVAMLARKSEALAAAKAEVQKAAPQRHVADLHAMRTLQQLLTRLFEADIMLHGLRRLADKALELPLQRAAGHAGDRGKFQKVPALSDIGMHRFEHAADGARQRCRQSGAFEAAFA